MWWEEICRRVCTRGAERVDEMSSDDNNAGWTMRAEQARERVGPPLDPSTALPPLPRRRSSRPSRRLINRMSGNDTLRLTPSGSSRNPTATHTHNTKLQSSVKPLTR